MFVFNKNIDMNEKDQRNALVVKLVDTKDLKSLSFWECQLESGRGHYYNEFISKKD